MIADDFDLEIERLGECRIPSPVSVGRFTKDNENVLYRVTLPEIESYLASGKRPLAFEQAGPREKIYFDPSKLKCGIVTCGGLCPGLNDVIRSIVLSLHFHYGVKTVFGFPYGYEGLSYRYGHTPLELTPKSVEGIHEKGGTILGSSRGPQDISEMVDTLERMNVGVLFTIGGDGTLKGAKAISEEVKKRGLKISVIGIPKTIDNDISYVQKSFGFETAVSEAKRVISAAHSEALGARNGIGLVKLMGRESGAYCLVRDPGVQRCQFLSYTGKPFHPSGVVRSTEEETSRQEPCCYSGCRGGRSGSAEKIWAIGMPPATYASKISACFFG